MQTIRTCPLCGEREDPIRYGDGFECNSCPFRCANKDYDKVVAAMELAEVEAWEEETDRVRKWLGSLTDNYCAYADIIDINMFAQRVVFAAREASNEVFNGPD